MKLNENGELETNDENPIKLAQMSECDSVTMNLLDESELQSKIGKLFRFELRKLNITEQGSYDAELNYIGTFKNKRKGADNMSKILFQHYARFSPMKYQHILDALKH